MWSLDSNNIFKGFNSSNISFLKTLQKANKRMLRTLKIEIANYMRDLEHAIKQLRSILNEIKKTYVFPIVKLTIKLKQRLPLMNSSQILIQIG